MPKRLHEGRPMGLNFSLILQQLQIDGHAEDEHMCSALAHMCGEVRFHLAVARMFYYVYCVFQPCALKNIQLPGGETLSCQESCIIPRYVSSSAPLTIKRNQIVLPAATKSTISIPAIVALAQ